MTRWVLLLAGAAVVALAALLAVDALRPSVGGRASQAQAIAAELRCPDCQALSVADSPTESAAEIRRQIELLLAEGRSPDEVRAHFVARYGEWILLAPSAPAPWILPPLAIAVAALALLAWLWRGRRSAARPPSPTADAEIRRVREEAEALDA